MYVLHLVTQYVEGQLQVIGNETLTFILKIRQPLRLQAIWLRVLCTNLTSIIAFRLDTTGGPDHIIPNSW